MERVVDRTDWGGDIVVAIGSGNSIKESQKPPREEKPNQRVVEHANGHGIRCREDL